MGRWRWIITFLDVDKDLATSGLYLATLAWYVFMN